MKLFSRYAIIALATRLACSTAIPWRQEDENLTITIESLGNTEIKAIITNIGAKTLRLLKEGTILDSAPVQKFYIQKHEQDERVPFEGIKKSIKYSNLSSSAFTSLDAGKSIEITVDIASVHDLTSGGIFHILSNGRIPLADRETNRIAGAVAFASNKLQMRIDGGQASQVRRAFAAKHKRDAKSRMNIDCKDKQLEVVKNAMQNCAVLATYAADKALTGPVQKFEQYFGPSDQNARTSIHDRYSAIAQECLASPSGGKTEVHCTDTYNACTESTIAFTISPVNTVTYCPSYWGMPSLTNECHGQDQTLTTVHEMSHADIVYAPGTEDRAYGYENDIALPGADKPKNADNYAQFVNGLWAGC